MTLFIIVMQVVQHTNVPSKKDLENKTEKNHSILNQKRLQNDISDAGIHQNRSNVEKGKTTLAKRLPQALIVGVAKCGTGMYLISPGLE